METEAMKKENELETSKIENGIIELDNTDLGTFLGDIARSLTKEGISLEALADKRLDEGETQCAVKRIGVDVSIWGEKLLLLRNKLCQKCKLQPVSIFLSFDDSNTKVEKKDNE